MRHFLTLLCLASLCARAQESPAVPDNLKPPAGEKLVRQVRGEGDQIYTCDGSNWTLAGPEAKLFDEAGHQVGSHFAGPTWEWSDGSRVAGRPIANATPDAESIPWLLLTATAHQGEGVLAGVSSIQRISTKGGEAPAAGCDPSHQGEKARVQYSAVYRFFSAERAAR